MRPRKSSSRPSQNRAGPSTKPFGPKLAAGVADLLAADGRVLAGYNAHWMRKSGDRLIYEALKDARREIFAAPSAAVFAAWLATQTPESLHDLVRTGCSDAVETISHSLLRDAVANRTGVLGAAAYGKELASRVAAALDRGVTIAYSHRDYGGMGLAKTDAGYIYGAVFDGRVGADRIFATPADFVGWLAAQSDVTLSGRDSANFFDWDNQRITSARLRDAVGQ